jgi:hypothetical protein
VPSRRVIGWVAAGVAAAVVVGITVLALVQTDEDPGRSGSAPPKSPSPSQSQSQSQGGSPTPDAEPDPGTYEVDSVLDDGTIQLANGSQVVLAGVTVGDCAVGALGGLVDGRQVVLSTPGPDTDSLGRLLRYVERDGLDVGLRLLQRGLASASDEPNPRRAIYQRVDDRSPDAC